MESYAVENYGCRASAADGDAIGESLERKAGLFRANWRDASVVVVNTCAVTAAAERDARAAIRRIMRSNPKARVVVTGCYAQRAPGELEALPGVAAVVGNSHKACVTETALLPASAITPATRTWHEPFPSSVTSASAWLQGHCDESAMPPAVDGGARTRPVLKVQEGCGNRCSFCVIPETRGPSRSVSMRVALDAARRFAERGGQELVLSGINLGRWGADLAPRRTLAELVRALLEETALPRLRLSSIEPMDWVPELVQLLARYSQGVHPRLAPHAHLPLQSGSDAILRAMHRRYRPWHYAAKIAELREVIPDGSLGADVLVGFPGEEDEHFSETLRLLETLPLSYLHLFPFSPRPGTAAEALHRTAGVSAKVVHARMGRLRALGEEKSRAFASRFLGRQLSAVTLSDGTALTANYLSVLLNPGGAANRLVCVQLASTLEEPCEPGSATARRTLRVRATESPGAGDSAKDCTLPFGAK